MKWKYKYMLKRSEYQSNFIDLIRYQIDQIGRALCSSGFATGSPVLLLPALVCHHLLTNFELLMHSRPEDAQL